GHSQPARPYADIPRDGSSQANTHGTPGGAGTKSDVNAATVLTVDAVPTSAPPPSAPVPPVQPVKTPDPSAPDLSSSVTIQQKPRVPADQENPRVSVDLTAPRKSRGKSLVFVGVGVLLLVVVVVAVGGVFALNW